MSGFYSMKVTNANLQLLYTFMFSFEAGPPKKQQNSRSAQKMILYSNLLQRIF